MPASIHDDMQAIRKKKGIIRKENSMHASFETCLHVSNVKKIEMIN